MADEQGDLPAPNQAASPADSERIVDAQQGIRKLQEQRPSTSLDIMTVMGSMGHPLHQKMDSSHISQLLNIAQQHDTNAYQLRQSRQDDDTKIGKSQMYLHFWIFVIVIALLVFVITVFHDKPEVLGPLVAGIGGLATGFVGGIGYANRRRRKSDEE